MNTTMGCCSQPPATTLSSSRASLKFFTLAPKSSSIPQFSFNNLYLSTAKQTNLRNNFVRKPQNFIYCSNSTIISPSETEEGEIISPSETEEGEIISPSETEEDEEEVEVDEGDYEDNKELKSLAVSGNVPPVKRRRRRYRKLYPGEKKGITEEMRFIAMKLRNSGKPRKAKSTADENSDSHKPSENEVRDSECSEIDGSVSVEEEEKDNGNGEIWQPSMEGFLKYLVDSKLVFSTIERIVDDSSDVSYAYFRKTGLERSECLSKDLDWLSQQGYVIPETSNPGVTYFRYLEELSEKSPSLFLCHFYNIYFSHITGGQVIAKKVSEKLLKGRELEFYKWEGEENEMLRDVREKLNAVGEHWSRDEKNKCLREATKAFRYLGQIVRLIVLL